MQKGLTTFKTVKTAGHLKFRPESGPKTPKTVRTGGILMGKGLAKPKMLKQPAF